MIFSLNYDLKSVLYYLTIVFKTLEHNTIAIITLFSEPQPTHGHLDSKC